MQHSLVILLFAVSHASEDNWSPIQAKDPVYYESIQDGDIKLEGIAGADADVIYLSQTVVSTNKWDSVLYDGDKVVTWAELTNPNEPDKNEGFYCMVDYNGNDGGSNVEVVTLVGTPDFPTVDMYAMSSSGRLPQDWCTKKEDNC